MRYIVKAEGAPESFDFYLEEEDISMIQAALGAYLSDYEGTYVLGNGKLKRMMRLIRLLG